MLVRTCVHGSVCVDVGMCVYMCLCVCVCVVCVCGWVDVHVFVSVFLHLFKLSDYVDVNL